MTHDPRTTTSVRLKPATSLPFPVAFREVEPSEVGFVTKSWIQGYHQGTPSMARIPFNRFKREQRAVIRDCLERGRCVVACDPDDDPDGDSRLYGFACGWDDLGVGVAHYVYVTHTRRSMGLAKALLRELGVACGRTMTAYSHSTMQGAGLARHLQLRHDPFALVRLIYASDPVVRQPAAPDGTGREHDAPPSAKRSAG